MDEMKNELEQKNNLVAIGALAIFYFVFLGGEYLFDNTDSSLPFFCKGSGGLKAGSWVSVGSVFYAISKYRDLSVRKTVAER